jgi:amino-acid N-acetyltransferase
MNLHTHIPQRSNAPIVPNVGVAIAEPPLELRCARAHDVDVIHGLIDAHLHEGHLLPRTREDIAAEVEQFVVATRDDVVVGCAELSRLAADVAEVRSLVVADDVQGQGLGRALVRELMATAQNSPYKRLCAFTHAPAFFVRLGFSIVPHLDVPEKVFIDCVGCPLFRRCGQHAVMFWLDDAGHRGRSPELEW